GLGDVTPARVLAGAEVGPVEDLLEAEELHALLAGLLDHREVLFDHRVAHLLDRSVLLVEGVGHLNEAADYLSRHVFILCSLRVRSRESLHQMRRERVAARAAGPTSPNSGHISGLLLG